MTSPLDAICEKRGIEISYISETGEHRRLDDRVKLALLDALGDEPDPISTDYSPPLGQCFIPEWLETSRAWGVTVQLFGVRSARNHGIGDFEDAARLCEILAEFGADFLGINPIHALFLAEPRRTSPYYPSTRQFLNPLYIAIDAIEGASADLPDINISAAKAGDHVDHVAVSNLKRRVLQRAYALAPENPEFDRFCAEEGGALDDFATFEALGEWFVALGHDVGWHSWPAAYHQPQTEEIASFRAEHAERIRFHKWLQWIASRQLAHVQQRAKAAGMRIGLYLDLAVGVAPDGAATWSRPDDYTRGTRVGAPPDLFNSVGQDWGLAPLKPSAMQGRQSGFAFDLAAAMRSAGAVRLDHAMGLKRLYWIPPGCDARQGGYIAYPLAASLDVLAGESRRASAIVIGEDLGTVPPGFREILQQARIFGNRVLYFERHDVGFHPAPSYAPLALACVATHDMPPLAGWWSGRDIEARQRLGWLDQDAADAARQQRGYHRSHLLEILASEGLHKSHAHGEEAEFSDALVAAHAFLARTPCRLVAIQLEDLLRATEQVNLPGTHQEHRNWSLRLPMMLEDVADDPLLIRVLAAVAAERPKDR